MKNLAKYKSILLWITIWIILFIFLQVKYNFHFFYIEQLQLFLFDWADISNKIAQPGGVAQVVSEFLVQFFAVPYTGAIIMASLLTLIGIQMEGIIKHLASQSYAPLLYLLPIVTLLYMLFEVNYRIQGVIAYSLVLLILYIYLRFTDFRYKLIYSLLLTPVLYWGVGAAAILFPVSVLLIELFNKTKFWYLFLIPCVEVCLIAIISVQFAIIGEYRFAFLPDAYFSSKLNPAAQIYFSWICIPIIICITFYLKRRKDISGKRNSIELFLQFVLLVILCWYGIPKYGEWNSAKYKELDYYARNEEWDKIIKACEGPLPNALYICTLNMALAEKGQLAESMFAYDQQGPNGLLIPWDMTLTISMLSSDIYFTVGNIAASQEMAFEGFVASSKDGNPRMLKRLVQTNIIYGNYAIAEKYIDKLEKTFHYKDWARNHRKYLYNDAEVEKDVLLSFKRKCLPKENYLFKSYGTEADFAKLAEENPSNRAAIEYLGAMFLLSGDMPGFKKVIETYYGTEVLPVLPKSFLQTVVTMYWNDPEAQAYFKIPQQVAQEFATYMNLIQAHGRNNPNLKNILQPKYGDTYWYYYMIKRG